MVCSHWFNFATYTLGHLPRMWFCPKSANEPREDTTSVTILSKSFHLMAVCSTHATVIYAKQIWKRSLADVLGSGGLEKTFHYLCSKVWTTFHLQPAGAETAVLQDCSLKINQLRYSSIRHTQESHCDAVLAETPCGAYWFARKDDSVQHHVCLKKGLSHVFGLMSVFPLDR